MTGGPLLRVVFKTRRGIAGSLGVSKYVREVRRFSSPQAHVSRTGSVTCMKLYVVRLVTINFLGLRYRSVFRKIQDEGSSQYVSSALGKMSAPSLS